MELEEIKERFLAFARSECIGSSALYYYLSRRIARDKELLSMASYTKPGQPVANLFLASVHYLMLKDPRNALAKYYPSITRKKTKEIPLRLFKEFCIANENEIKKLLSTKIVQTNVIGRCSYLMPVFSQIIALENKPTTLIDIGTSAGLTLNFDKYEYWYNGDTCYGKSDIIVQSTIVGSSLPDIFEIDQPITKIGIDQHVIDPTDPEEMLWLKALIWPDQLERFTALEEALRLDDLKKISFVQADGISGFENQILQVAEDQNLIIYATHVLYQFSREQKENFYDMLERMGKRRDFYFLSVEGIKVLWDRNNTSKTVIELTRYKSSQKIRTFIAETNGHGNWIKWKKSLAIAQDLELQPRS